MTSRTLERLCRHWIRVLGLQHWEFVVRFATQDQLSDSAESVYYGKCYPDLDSMRAHIWIANERDLSDEAVAALTICPDDRKVIIEQTVIHELLHVRLDPSMALKNDSNFESGLNHVARALWESGGLLK